jgi:hypothetical protein
VAEGSFAPSPDRDPAPLDQLISDYSGFVTDDYLMAPITQKPGPGVSFINKKRFEYTRPKNSFC